MLHVNNLCMSLFLSACNMPGMFDLNGAGPGNPSPSPIEKFLSDVCRNGSKSFKNCVIGGITSSLAIRIYRFM